MGPGGATFRCERRVVLVTALVAAFSASLLGCAEKESAKTKQDDSDDVVKTEVERGPVKLTVALRPAKPRLSDEPTLTVTIRAKKGTQIEKPPFGESLGEFLIHDFREPLPTVDDEFEVTEQVYTLEATRSGTLQISPILVSFYAGDEKHTIESEALSVEVSSMVAEDVPTLDDLLPASDPIALPDSRDWRTLWVALAALGVGIVGLLGWRRWRKRSVPDGPQLGPREQAWLELEAIIAHDLASIDVKQYYVELTGVVRRYIERSTGIRAPEQTTEEFLVEMARRKAFSAEENDRLQDFLESADLVKFAAAQPTKEDIEASFERAKQFVGFGRPTSQTTETEVRS